MDESTRSSLPEPNTVDPVPDSVREPDEVDGEVDLSHLSAEHRPVLRRLHRRVEQTRETIERLRTENQRLRQRVEELEAEPRVPKDKAVLTLDDDPEELREQITDFIGAIDTYLETESMDAVPDEESEEGSAEDADA